MTDVLKLEAVHLAEYKWTKKEEERLRQEAIEKAKQEKDGEEEGNGWLWDVCNDWWGSVTIIIIITCVLV